MACLYGVDVLAPATWGAFPDLVISGPNEGDNMGRARSVPYSFVRSKKCTRFETTRRSSKLGAFRSIDRSIDHPQK